MFIQIAQEELSEPDTIDSISYVFESKFFLFECCPYKYTVFLTDSDYSILADIPHFVFRRVMPFFYFIWIPSLRSFDLPPEN